MMQSKHIDTHSHLDTGKFNADRDEVLARMREASVATLAVGVTPQSSKAAVELAQKEDLVLGAVIGAHPTDMRGKEFDISELEPLLKSGVVVGVGECGLDYYRNSKEEVGTYQREIFESQVVFAAENDLPLMLHVRASEESTDAHDDTLEILKLYQKEYGSVVRGNVHFFTSTKEVAREYLALGFYISFPGVVTFAPELDEVVRDVPLDMMLAETDSPYAAPVPHRGKRNEPTFVIDTIRYIAEVRGESFNTVAAQLTANAKALFLGAK